jgi:hypothetical protein
MPTPTAGQSQKKAPHLRGFLIFIASPDPVVRRQLLPAGAADFPSALPMARRVITSI